MIYFNDEPIDFRNYKKNLRPGEKKKDGLEELKKEFPWFPKKPVILKYESSLVKRNPKDNKLIYPVARAIDTTARVSDEDGRDVTARYAETRTQDQNGNFIYSPGHIFIEPLSMTFNKQDAEKLWFIWKFAKNVKNGAAIKKRYPSDLEFVHKQKAAEEFIKKEMELEKVRSIVLDEKISNSQLKKIAKGIFISGTDDMNKYELKSAILSHLQVKDEATKIKRYEDFVRVVDVDEVLEARANIQDAIDMGIIKLDSPTRKWHFYDSKSRRKLDEIVFVRTGEDLYVGLYDAVMNDPKLIQKMENMLNSVKRETGVKEVDKETKPDKK